MRLKLKDVRPRISRHLVTAFGISVWMVGERVHTDWDEFKSTYHVTLWYYRRNKGTINRLL